MRVQARFFVNQIIKNTTDNISVQLKAAVRGEGNKDWAKYTPSGQIDLNVSEGTGAAEFFESMLGKDVAITFEAVEEA